MRTVLIRIEGDAEHGYHVRLLTGDDGEPADGDPSENIPGDLNAATAPAALQGGKMQEAIRDFLHDTPESTEFPAIGKYVASLLLPGAVGERWDALRQDNPDGLRTLLKIEAGELREVPWELAFRGNVRLFIAPEAVFARLQDLRPGPEPELVPLRVLVVAGQQDGPDELGVTAEMRGIKAALPAFKGRIEAEFLREPPKVKFLEALERVRPHIFHFIGHGLLEAGGERALLVGGWSLTAQFVRESFRPKGIAMPRIAVLNACRSGEAARAGSLAVEDVRGLMDAFLESGTGAAIGMQGDVRGRAAFLFGTGLYGALAEGLDVDRAVAAARKKMVDLADNAQARDWCLPSLTLCVLPEQVLRFECAIEEQDVTNVEADIFTPIKLFVDRMPTRWDFARAADPGDRKRPGNERGDGGERPVRVVRVVGDMDSGKTWLVQWIRTRLALRGRRVRYVDFKAQDNLDFVRTLEIIRDTAEDVASLAGPAQGAFDRFTFELGYLVNGQIPPEETVGEPPPIPDRLQLGGDNEQLIFASFRKALERAAGNGELILIFDHVDGVSKTDFPTRIFRHLIEPREPANVRLIVVLSKEEERSYWPSDAERIGARVDVALFNLDDYDACAEDVVLALGKEFGDNHRKLIDGLKPFKEPPMSPRELREIARIVGGR